MLWLLFSLFTVVSGQSYVELRSEYGENENDYIGKSVTMTPDTNFIAWSRDFDGGKGQIQVFNTTGSTYTRIGDPIVGEKIPNSEAIGSTDIELSHDGLTVAASFDQYYSNRGQIRVWRYIDGVWEPIGKFEGTVEKKYLMSFDLSEDGNSIAIAAANVPDGNPQENAYAKIYTYSNNAWTQKGLTLEATVGGKYKAFVKMKNNGNLVAFTTVGDADVYEFKDQAWSKIGDLNSDSKCGHNIDVVDDGTMAAVGCMGDNNNGEVKIYERSGNTWQYQSSIMGIYNNKMYFHPTFNSDGTLIAIKSQRNNNNNQYYTNLWYYDDDLSRWDTVVDNVQLLTSTSPYARDYLSTDGHTIITSDKFGDSGSTSNTGKITLWTIHRCLENQYASRGLCRGCPQGKSNEAGDPKYLLTECDTIICKELERVYNFECVACAQGKYSPAGLKATVGISSQCADWLCAENEKVSSFKCVPCEPGTTNAPGDDASTGDTQCDKTLCPKNERVLNHNCTACPPGTIRPAGDDASGADTLCTQALCSENHRVKNNECVPCEDGLIRLAGDRADRADTQCFDASTCGGVTCDPTGTKECVNHRCICNNYFGGQDCSKDRSPSARRKQLLKARKKALPTRANLKQRQKEVKDLAKEILQEEIAKGLSTKQAIKNSKVEVELQDIQQEVQVVVSKMAKTPVLAVGPENKDETDTCDQGPQCASLDIAEEGDEITFLDTAEDSGSWTTLTNGNDIVSKQTRVSESVYEMQCWNNTWGPKTTMDVTNGGKLYECNGHIILVGSQASVCTPTTCQNGGTCSKDGLSFKCTCPDGFTGEFCETSADVTHCHQIDCSDFGGHKAGECTDCDVANCCNYASRTLFDAHCDTLTATQDFVNAKCCHRTYCL